MRINQSSNWRALAVLGALLSVIIVWPTVLSMPMLTARETSSATNEHQSSQLEFSTSPNDTTVAAINNSPDHDYNYTNNFNDYSDYGKYLFHLNTSDISDNQTDDRPYDQSDIDPIMTSFDDTVNQSRRVKKSPHSGSMDKSQSKRRKKVNSNDNVENDQVSAEDNVSNTTYLSSASISESRVRSFSDNESSVSVSESSSPSSDQADVSHHYQSKRTRNLYKSDRSDSRDSDNDDGDVIRNIASTPNRGWKYYLSTTITPSYDIDVTSEYWHNDETNDDDRDISDRTSTHANTEYPVLSRTDRSVHTKRGISDRQRGRQSNNGGAAAVSGEGGETGANGGGGIGGGGGGSIKSRRLHIHNKNHNYRNNDHTNSNRSNLDRNERSTVAHSISGPGRKIQLFIKNRFIQLMPDGTVNGSLEQQSDYTILQRTTVDVGRIKIQGVATCLYLCMDQCGAVYGSKEFTDDCVFNESMEQHNYNTYSSTYNSNSRRIYYLALNRHGEPRKLQIPPSRSLGKLATYTKAITETVTQDRVEALIAKKFGANRVKHGIRQLCDTGKPLVELTDKTIKARPQCTAANSNSNSNSNSNTSNKNGQLNVPAANDKSRLSNLTNSISRSSSSSGTSSNNNNSSSSTSSSSNGHTSGNSNNNHLIKNKKKRRRCRPGESEDEHNCQPGGPHAMKKRPPKNGNGNKMPKCKDVAASDPPVECTKRPKKGGKNKHGNGGGGSKHNGRAKHNGDGKNGGGGASGGGGNAEGGRKGGKKLNQNGRQQQGGNNNNKKKNNNKQPKNGLSGGGRTTTTTTTTTTTIHPITTNNKVARTPRSRSAPTTPTTTTTTTTTTETPTTTTSTAAATTTELTASASNQMIDVINQGTIDQLSGESLNDDDLDDEDHSVEEETAEAEDDDDDMAPNDDDHISHPAYTGEHAKPVMLTSDAAAFDDEYDSLPLGLWEIVLVAWITKWFL